MAQASIPTRDGGSFSKNARHRDASASADQQLAFRVDAVT
jgi:hypothetical protein